MREALNFYAAPENWISSSEQEQSGAFDDRGEMARLALGNQYVERTSSTHPTP
jgi:hypothetical protein